jgi:hypothetical protein
MQPSAHEVPSKTPDVHFGETDMTIAPWNVSFWPKADIPIALPNVRFRG